ncbi:DUF397 domain-containing protein [Streptomyces sp. 4N509B]|uniref:DUF397 domain-containing protein n=1 Tax=Streptomyces sp. 4N509B TaxID=3457413 RepID=UPI003FD65309
MSTPRPTNIPPGRWRKSSFSGGANDCVELFDTGSTLLLRDSKFPQHGPLEVTRPSFKHLIRSLNSDSLDAQHHNSMP